MNRGYFTAGDLHSSPQDSELGLRASSGGLDWVPAYSHLLDESSGSSLLHKMLPDVRLSLGSIWPEYSSVRLNIHRLMFG